MSNFPTILFELSLLTSFSGPNHYQPEKSHMDHQPAFSFGSRPEEKIKSLAPAPNHYNIDKTNLDNQPAFSFGGRHNLEKPSQTPGRFWFDFKAIKQSLTNGFYFKSTAPNQYQVDRVNPEQPGFSFGSRPEEKIKSNAPAPNHYHVERTRLDDQPAFSFGGRYDTEKPSQTPAPSAYNPGNLDHQPAFSFGSRPEEKVRSDTPGKTNFLSH